jgi:CheY-like chemotaxis protein
VNDALKLDLVAEDVQTTREVLSFLPSSRSYEVVETVNGIEALEKARAILPALVFLDSELPGMSGYDVYRELKRDPASRGIPMPFLVADTDEFALPTSSIPPAEFLISNLFQRKISSSALGRLCHRNPSAGAYPPDGQFLERTQTGA